MNTQLNHFNALLRKSGKSIIVNNSQNIVGVFKEIDDKNNSIDTKYFYAKENLNQGDILVWNNSTYIILTKNDSINNTYTIYTVRKCPYKINYVVNNIVFPYYSYIDTKVFNISTGGEMALAEGTINVTTQCNKVTEQLTVNGRFIKMNRAWKISGNDMSKEGLVTLSCSVDSTASGDNLIIEIPEGSHVYAPIVTINPSNIVLNQGTTQQLTVSVSDNGTTESVTYNYSSSAPNIATIDANGLITGIKEGNCNINISFVGADYKTYSYTTPITVTNDYVLSVNPTSIAINTKQTQQITATISKNNVNVDGAVYSYSSSDTTIATVDNTGLVTPIKAGSCNITVTATIDGKTYNKTVNATITQANNYALNVSPTAISIDKGSTQQLTITVTNNGTAVNNPTITYNSSDTGIATVNSSGLVTGVNAGSCNITVTFTSTDGEIVNKIISTEIKAVAAGQNKVALTSQNDDSNTIDTIYLDSYNIYSVYQYVNNTANSDTFTFTQTFANDNTGNKYYTFTATDGNHFKVENNSMSYKPLTITCTNTRDNSTVSIIINLEGVS